MSPVVRSLFFLRKPFSADFDRDWRSAFSSLSLSLSLLWIVILQPIVLRYWPGWPLKAPRRFHQALCRAIGFEVSVGGQRVDDKAVLYVANHISWVDIPVLGSTVIGSFVAKAEVAQMGAVGWLANLQRTIYIKREARGQAGVQRNEIAERLLKGENVILFPEGTSTQGTSVLPFKSTLFGVTDTPGLEDVLIQPVTIAYTRLNGLPMLRQQRYKVAWIGDMDFGPHAWALIGLGRVGAVVYFHPPVRRRDFNSRKTLAQHCQSVIVTCLKRLNAGYDV